MSPLTEAREQSKVVLFSLNNIEGQDSRSNLGRLYRSASGGIPDILLLAFPFTFVC